MHAILADTAGAVDDHNPTAFVHANWRLHRRIAAVSANPVIRSLYLSLFDQIESQNLDVGGPNRSGRRGRRTTPPYGDGSPTGKVGSRSADQLQSTRSSAGSCPAT
jgi:hypothetical protein